MSFVYLETNFLTYFPSCLCGTKGSNEIFPTLPIFSQFSNGTPAVIELPQSLFYSSAPGCFWAPSAPFAFRCPAHCNSGYVVLVLSQHMPDPSPSSPGDKGTNRPLQKRERTGKSIVVFRLFEKLRYSNLRSTIFQSLYHEQKYLEEENGKMVALQILPKIQSLYGLGRLAKKL